MKSPTTEFFRTDSAVFRFLFSVSLIILPFIQFLVEQRYLVLRLETVVYFLCLTAACLTFAWFTRKPVVFHAAAILWLCVMQVPYTQSLHDRLLAVKPAYLIIGVCTSLPTTPHLVVGRSACRVGVGPSLNRSWAQRSRPVVQAGRRAFPGDESVVD